MVSWIFSCILLATLNGQADCTIIYFGSANCAPCDKITPALTQLKNEGWDIRAVNAPQRPDLAKQYKVDNLPTVVIISQQAQREVDRIVGAVSYEQLHSRFERAASRSPSNSATILNNLANSHAANSNFASVNPQQQQQQQQTGPTVRGQSPSAGGFPMLASVGAMGSSAAATMHEMASAVTATPPPSASLGHAQPRASDSPSLNHQAPDNRRQLETGNQPSPPQRTVLSLEQAVTRALAATVRIKVEEENTTAFGSGTVIDVHGTEALVLTCGHLFRDMKRGSQLSVDLFAGTPHEMNVLAKLIDFKAEDEDIGLVSFALPVAIEAVEILPRNEALQVGQPAFSYGCDHGQPPTKRDTKIRSINRYLGAANVEIVGAPAIGRSGGGLFDQQGRLIGVCNAACTNEDEGIYAAAEVVYTQIERLGLSHLFDPKLNSTGQLASADPMNNAPPQNNFAAQVQPASFAQPPSSAPTNRAWTSPDANDEFTWPDQPRATTTQAAPSSQAAPSALADTPANSQVGIVLNSLAERSQNAINSTTDAQEIICIMRDATGQSRVVTIPRPAPELLHAIENHSSTMLAPR